MASQQVDEFSSLPVLQQQQKRRKNRRTPVLRVLDPSQRDLSKFSHDQVVRVHNPEEAQYVADLSKTFKKKDRASIVLQEHLLARRAQVRREERDSKSNRVTQSKPVSPAEVLYLAEDSSLPPLVDSDDEDSEEEILRALVEPPKNVSPFATIDDAVAARVADLAARSPSAATPTASAAVESVWHDAPSPPSDPEPEIPSVFSRLFPDFGIKKGADAVADLAHRMPKIAQQLKEALSKLNTTADTMGSSFKMSVDTLSQRFEAFTLSLPTKDELKRDVAKMGDVAISSLADQGILLLCVGGILYCVFSIIRAETNSEMASFAVLGSCLLGVVIMRYQAFISRFASSCYDTLSSWFSAKIKEQAVVEDDGIWSSLGSVISSLISCAIVGTAPAGKALEKMATCLGNWRRVADGTTEFATWLGDIFSKLFRKIRAFFGDVQAEKFATGIEAVDQWQTRVMVYVNTHATMKDKPINPDGFKDILSLQHEGVELKAKHCKGRDGTVLSRCIDNWLDMLKPIYRIYEAAAISHSMRMVPVCVYMYGPPGTGKSSAAQALSHHVLAYYWRNEPEYLKLLAKDPNLYTYAHDPSREFWDGCRPDILVIFFNDFFQSKDPAGAEALEFMRTVDTFPQQLHMSEISDKKATFIHPILVIVSSNLEKAPSDLLRAPAALDRRMHIRVFSTYRQEYCLPETEIGDPISRLKARKLDKEKLGIDETVRFGNAVGHPWDPEILEYHVMDESGALGQTLGFFDLVSACNARLDQHRADFKAQMDSYSKRITAEVAKYLPATHSGCSEACGRCEKCLAHRQSTEAKGKAHLDERVDSEVTVVGPTSAQVEEAEDRLLADSTDNHWNKVVDKKMGDLVAAASAASVAERTADIAHASVLGLLRSQAPADLEHWSKFRKASRASWGNHVVHPEIRHAIAQRHPLWRDEVINEVAHVLENSVATVVVRSGLSGPLGELDSYKLALWLCRFSAGSEGFAPLLSVVDYRVKVDPSKAWSEFKRQAALVYAEYSGNSYAKTLSFCREWFPVVSGILAACAVAHSVYRYFRPSPDGVNSGERQPKMTQKLVIAQPPPLEVKAVNSAIDKTGEDLIRQALSSNVYKILDSTGACANGLVLIKGRAFLINTHFVNRIRKWVKDGTANPDNYFSISKPLTGSPVHQISIMDFVKAKSVTEFETGDLSMGVLTNAQVPQATDMTEKFPTFAEHALFFRDGHYGAVLNFTGDSPIVTVCPVTPIENWEAADPVEGNIKIRRGYTYPGKFGPGTCMSLVFSCNPLARASRVIGAHTAGTSASGDCTILIREAIVKTLTELEEKKPQIAPETKPTNTDPGTLFHGFPIIRTVPKEEQHHTAGRTELTPSRIGALRDKPWPDLYAPARLRPFVKNGVVIDPYVNAALKYSYRCPHPNVFKPVKAVCQSLRSSLEKAAAGYPARVGRILTFQEAIAGIQFDDYIGSMPRQTSPGYPHVLRSHGMGGKTYWLGKDGPVDFNTAPIKELEQEVLSAICSMEKGVIPEFICLDFLKDELRTKEKVEEGKTRFISATNIVLLSIMKEYFGDFVAWMQAARIGNGSAIGINVHSAEWQRVVTQLCGIGTKNLADSDISGLDTSLLATICEAILKHVIEPHYPNSTLQERLVRKCCFELLVRSTHIYGGVIYQWMMGHPSGHFLTALLNTLYMLVADRLAWLWCCKLPLHHLPAYDQHCRIVVQGDDNVSNRSEAVAEAMTADRVAQAFKQIGLIMTDPRDKNKPPPKEYKKLEEITFLKRGFVPDARVNRYVAPLSLETITTMINWHSRKDTSHEFAKATFGNAIRELAVHPKPVWDEYAPKMFTLYKRAYGYSYPILSRDTLFFECQSLPSDQDLIGMLGGAASKGDGPFFSCGQGLATLAESTESPTLLVLAAVPYLGSSDTAEQPSVNSSSRPVFTGYIRHDDGVVGRMQPVAQSSNPLTTPDTVQVPSNVPAKETVSITAIEAERPGARGVLERASGLPPILRHMNSTQFEPTLARWLANPVKFASVDVDASNTTRSAVFTFPLNGFFVAPSVAPKLMGFQGISGDMIVRVVSNANAYQQGRYRLVWMPAYSMPGLGYTTRLTSLATITQLPGEDLDIACDSEVSLRIPFVFPSAFHNLMNGNGDYGAVALIVYDAFQTGSGGSTTFNVTGFVSMVENTVQLYNPTYNASPMAKPVNSGRMPKMGNVTDQELGSAGKGFISSTAGAIADLAGTATVLAPELAEYTEPVRWIAKFAEGAASMFGLSKPRDERETSRMETQILYGNQNADVINTSHQLGLMNYNRNQLMKSFAGKNVDEMNLNYLLSQSFWYKTVNWAGTDSTGTMIYSQQMNPYVFTADPFITPTPGGSFGGPLSYLVNFFEYWRGSIRLKFKLVKTTSHQGRLEFVFYPGAAVAPTAANTVYGHREIMDIANFNEYSFTVPYTSDLPYQVTAGGASYGVVAIYVLNELTGPSTVASNINILCEVSAGPDFELYGVRNNDTCPAVLSLPTAPKPTNSGATPDSFGFKQEKPDLEESTEEAPLCENHARMDLVRAQRLLECTRTPRKTLVLYGRNTAYIVRSCRGCRKGIFQCTCQNLTSWVRWLSECGDQAALPWVEINGEDHLFLYFHPDGRLRDFPSGHVDFPIQNVLGRARVQKKKKAVPANSRVYTVPPQFASMSPQTAEAAAKAVDSGIMLVAELEAHGHISVGTGSLVLPKPTNSGAMPAMSGVACRAVENGPIGGAVIKDPGVAPAQYIAGERVTTVKQMMLAATPVLLSGVSVMTAANQYTYRPYTIGVSYPVTGALVNADFSLDYMSKIAPMYAYSRGCVQFNMYGMQSTTIGSPFLANLESSSSIVNPVTIAAVSTTSESLRRTAFGTNNNLQLTVPHYGATWARINRLSTIRGAVGTPEPRDLYAARVLVRVLAPNGTAGILKVTRNVADDFQLGMFIGCLPFTVSSFAEPPAIMVSDPEDQSALSIDVDSLPSTPKVLPGWKAGSPQQESGNMGLYRVPATNLSRPGR